MSEVEKLCDIIGIIQSGKLLAEGSACRASEQYKEQTSRDFREVVAPHYKPEERLTCPCRNIGTVYRKELTDSLRDRRTLISTLLVLCFCFPILSWDSPRLPYARKEKRRKRSQGDAAWRRGLTWCAGSFARKQKDRSRAGDSGLEDRSSTRRFALGRDSRWFEASLAQQNPQTVEIYKYEAS